MRLFLTIAACIALVNGHGRLMSPAARNAMWRFGFPNPVNYNDNEVVCGGFGTQYDKNDGKCGVCGDSWSDPQPREHEGGGKFGKGVIAKHYSVGQVIDIEVDLTTNHWGYFELKVCPSFDKTKPVTQECLDAHPLYLADDPTSYQYHIPRHFNKSAYVTYQVRLPPGLTCQQCVMQWTYMTGNTWGTCEDGTEKVGCGVQETFRNCADIQIYSIAGGIPPNAVNTPSNAIYLRNSLGEAKPIVVTYQVCVAAGYYRKIPDMDKWCQENCLQYPSSCSKDKCKCLNTCESIGDYKDVEGGDVWCQQQCLRYPSVCPEDRCKCWAEDDGFRVAEE